MRRRRHRTAGRHDRRPLVRETRACRTTNGHHATRSTPLWFQAALGAGRSIVQRRGPGEAALRGVIS